MKRLLGILIVLSVLWGGYWVVGARSAKSAFTTWFEDRRAEGWQADYSDLAVRGFPNRFDTTFTDIAIADPNTGWAWSAPWFQLLALSYQPTKVIAIFPPESLLSTPLETLALTMGDLRASLNLQAAPRLPLERTTLVGRDLRLAPAGATAEAPALALGTLRLALERLPGDDSAYRHGALIEDLALPAPLLNRLAAGVALPDRIARLEIDYDADYDRAWDLDAIERARPQPRRITLRLAQAEWGALKLAATGKLDVDTAGIPSGTISVKAEQWRDMLKVAVAAGAMPQSVADSVERALALVANLSGRPDTLNVSFDLADGLIYLGPVPIGPAPVIRLR